MPRSSRVCSDPFRAINGSLNRSAPNSTGYYQRVGDDLDMLIDALGLKQAA